MVKTSKKTDPNQPKRLPGRPSSFTQAVADRICEELRKGRTVRSICEEDWAPSREGLFGWCEKFPIFADQYARSFNEGLDVLAEQTIDESMAYVAPEDVPAARHRFDVRRWYLSKRSP